MLKKLIRCNTKVATANISKKNMHVGKVNGKDLHAEYYVIENVSHMIRGAVMNGLRYGNERFDALADSLMTSNARIPAPMSHPSDESGNFVDANDPITFPSHNVGAFDTDWRVNGDKLISNTYIPVDSIDNPKAGNEWLSDSVNNKSAIDRSTGLYLNIDDSITGYGVDGEPFFGDVTEIYELNHSAILNPDVEPGAKNNGEGVGMFTNAKGDKIEIDEFDMQTNASTPAMRLPLAPDTHVFNEADALDNIKAYTNSTDKPSTSYRKFFLNFDQDNVDSFDSYTNLFADVIDGVPHAIKSQVANVDNDHAKAYANRFDNEMKGNKQSFVKKVLNKIFGAIVGNEASHENIHEQIYKKLNEGKSDCSMSSWPIEVYDSYFVYRGDNDKLYKQSYAMVEDEVTFVSEKIEVEREVEYKPITNNSESIMDKAKLIALLAANGITANADMSDADLEAALNTALSDKPAKPVVDTATNDKIDALTATVESLTKTISLNADKELNTARESVVAMNKGIDKEMAETMSLEHCNKFLASHGHVAVNAHGTQQNNNDDGVTAALPE